MTLSKMIKRVRSRSRTDDDFVEDSEVQDAIDEAIKKFSKDVNGLTKDAFLTLAPRFWTSTEMAIKLTILDGTNILAETEVVVTGTDREGVSGATVASDLQATIRTAGAASATVTFSTTTWKFTIDSLDSSSITVAAPTSIIYADATELLFGLSGEQVSSTWVSAIAQDANMEVALPADYLTELSVEWDRDPLYKSTIDLFMSPETVGRPEIYYIRNKLMRISPVPTSQKLFFIRYRYLPTVLGATAQAYQELGLTSKTGATATGLATTTAYKFYLKIDAGDSAEYTITTAATVTFTAVIALLNAQTTGATWSLFGGDLRCVSDTAGAASDIVLGAGQTGTDLFSSLTDFSELELPYHFGDDEVDIPDEAEDAIVLYATVVMYENKGNLKKAVHFLARYHQAKSEYRVFVGSQNTPYRRHRKQTSRFPYSWRRDNYTVTT